MNKTVTFRIWRGDATGGKLSGIVPAHYIAELVAQTLAEQKGKP